MENPIQEHHDDDDIQRINLEKDVNEWNKEIEFIQKELIFYSKLLDSKLVRKANANEEDESYILLKSVTQLKEKNSQFQLQLLDFENKSEEIVECEDVQCETFFLNEHFSFKQKLIAHVAKVRTVKKIIFDFFESNL
ncbi:hypothetical protein RBU60_07680 [Mesonia sp. MT50]|uniref:Uncharacterized protein n=1 Tax=Mesonia profundi TaxID=3070998 RepID=A0ABU1A165_9FLAO|nr:hypothetical protein [Mesonia profundi]MDQ7917450.1 hypothetical protein [Mesonia profundi]